MPTKLDHQLSALLAKVIERLEDVKIDDEKLQKYIKEYKELLGTKES